MKQKRILALLLAALTVSAVAGAVAIVASSAAIWAITPITGRVFSVCVTTGRGRGRALRRRREIAGAHRNALAVVFISALTGGIFLLFFHYFL